MISLLITACCDNSGVSRVVTLKSPDGVFADRFSDVGQNILINFCNLLYLVFLCNFRYFRFRAFISLFFGVFNVV